MDGFFGQQCTNPSAPIDSIASSAGSLHRTDTRASINSVISFAGSINTKKAFKTFCNDLYGVGVTAEVISQKRSEILNILMPQNTIISGQADDSNVVDHSQLLAVSNCSIFVDRDI